ncbi:GTPase-activating protein [Lithospermum erythrorhizon]|uniref:GTPase-activating protein n=1 Tax=Lithospermum erythrorhizon TaxID=34254 RepID=A0AAV3PYY5_LITER
MTFNREEKHWKCGKGGGLTLQRVSTIVRDIGDPCFHQSPIKVVIAISRMLKPEKWQATFDNDGKIFGFQRVLKSIILGGVDPSIRSEVWEFLLGCYALNSTAEHRRQLRAARRERYKDLVKQCQTMHSSIGTGSLAYVVGSKVMDMRTSSRDEQNQEAEVDSRKDSGVNHSTVDNNGQHDDNCIDRTYSCQRGSSIDSGGVVSVGGSMEETQYDSSFSLPTCGLNGWDLRNSLSEANGGDNPTEDCFDFPSLPVTDLFEKNKKNKKTRRSRSHDDRQLRRRKLGFRNERMHSFQITNNADLVVELYSPPSKFFSHPAISEVEAINSAESGTVVLSTNLECETEMLNRLKISDTSETMASHGSTSQLEALNEERISEWLWTLHRIVVDVVRTDSHLEFYEDTRNLARMSDILAVYAWVYPTTGYCQGMSDILSPFVVLFEDNADAFWCFEMLLRRMRENFQIEGPTGVMKQLQVLWHILKLTDKEMFAHLSKVGAESLHFAFRMLLVLFRRELSFDDALHMWEMMWAADFDECVALKLEEHCPELLLLQVPRKSDEEPREQRKIDHGSDDGSQSNDGIIEYSLSGNNRIRSLSYPFCGFATNLWGKHNRMQTSNFVVTRSGDDDLAVFIVAAILVLNRQKIIKETRSIDDLIKIFNDRLLKIRVKRCVRAAIKLRKKYYYKLVKDKGSATQNGEETPTTV